MGPVHIQIIEGNPHLRSLLSWHLQQVGYTVHQSASIQQAKVTFQQHHPSLVVLDSELPDGNGLELCSWLHRQHKTLVFVLSARNTESEIVEGLRAGADDYLTKPFGMQEFLARVEALSRRTQSAAPPAYLDYGTLKIDLVQRRVRFNGALIDLTPQEFSLLYVLAQAAGQPLSRTELLQRAWPDEIDNPRTVDTHILSLRKKIETNPRQPSLIQTVRNVGYCFNLEGFKQIQAQREGLDLASGPRPVEENGNGSAGAAGNSLNRNPAYYSPLTAQSQPRSSVN